MPAPYHMDDDRFSQPPRRSHVGSLLLVLAGGALALLLVCGGTLAVFVYFVQSASKLGNAIQQQMLLQERERQAHDLAYTFLQNCLQGHFPEAYALTSAAFQKRCQLEQLRQLFLREPLAPPQPLHPADVFQTEPGAREYRLVLPTANQKEQVTIRVVLVPDGESWKIDDVRLERGPHNAAEQPAFPEKEKN